MIKSLLVKMFKTRNERLLNTLTPVLAEINALESEVQKLSDAEIKNKSLELKQQVQTGIKSLKSITPMAFALCREASLRVTSMRHFDVQILGALALDDGKIAEMRTGEGKTLVATLAAYLNGLTGKGVHVFTVNDYLASRDYHTNKPLFDFLGITSGVIYSNQPDDEKREVYKCDVVYGTNSEFGFDYLRDNLVKHLDQKVQRTLNFAIVDEVDSILIDESRTPLVISGQAEEATDMYIFMDRVTQILRVDTPDEAGHIIIDEEKRDVHITEIGYSRVEEILVNSGVIDNHYDMYSVHGIRLLHILNNALKANYLYHPEQHYIVKDGEVIIVDEFTGRLSEGRRWGDGLHQAVEAKENVEIQPENKTIATITYQNFFMLYNKLSGMTGTAGTEANEFYSTYGLEVVTVPTNKPIARKDYYDHIFVNFDQKINAVVKDIQEAHLRKQPVLVGTATIESSEIVSSYLKNLNIPHKVLNAKYHEQEAAIISQAGAPGAVTIATNMAGRGTDIILGGNIAFDKRNIETDSTLTPEERALKLYALTSKWVRDNETVINAGGLRVIGVEKNEARRIDNQLRGRAGRQGDPGESIFYISLDDNLFRIFGGDRVKQIVERMSGMDNSDEPIQSSLTSKVLANAQIKLENNSFNMRKQLKEYDTVLSEQRQAIYALRDDVLSEEDMRPYVLNSINAVTKHAMQNALGYNEYSEETYDFDKIWNELSYISTKPKEVIISDLKTLDTGNDIEAYISSLLVHEYDNYKDRLLVVEKSYFMQALDDNWQSHLTAMNEIQNLIHLRGYAQKDPKQEYKREAFESFARIVDVITMEYGYMILNTILQLHDITSREKHLVQQDKDNDLVQIHNA